MELFPLRVRLLTTISFETGFSALNCQQPAIFESLPRAVSVAQPGPTCHMQQPPEAWEVYKAPDGSASHPCLTHKGAARRVPGGLQEWADGGSDGGVGKLGITAALGGHCLPQMTGADSPFSLACTSRDAQKAGPLTASSPCFNLTFQGVPPSPGTTLATHPWLFLLKRRLLRESPRCPLS